MAGLDMLRRWIARAACPESRELLAYRDRELDVRPRLRIGRHLAGCDSCSRELGRLDRAREAFRDACVAEADAALPDVVAGRDRLRLAIRAHQTASFADTALGRALAAELGAYLGEQTAVDMLGRVVDADPDGQTVVTAVEPALATFLGRTAAAAVAAKLLRMFELDAEAGAGGSAVADAG